MAFLILLILAVVTTSHGMNSLNFSVRYFVERNISFVCMVQCQHDVLWRNYFARLASNHSVAVSNINTMSKSWLRDTERCMQYTQTAVGIVLNENCTSENKKILNQASENMWFDSRHVWLTIDNYHNATENFHNLTDYSANGTLVPFLGILANLNISVDADIVLAVKTDISHYRLFDIFNFGKVQGGILNVVDAGYWSVDIASDEHILQVSVMWLCAGFQTDLNIYKYYRRWDFGQLPLRGVFVASVPAEDFKLSMLSSLLPLPGVSSITRTSTNIFRVVTELHNIKTIYSITDRWIGSFERNNTKIVTNALYYREQDFSPVLRMMPHHVSKLGYLLPALTFLETKYYYRITTTGAGKYENQFLRPLSVDVWWCLVAVMVLCAIILVAASRLEQRPSSVQFALFSVTANICQQFFVDGIAVRRPSAATKLTIFITGVACVLFYNYYTSSVVSWLLNGPPPSINSLQELYESPLNLIYQDIGYTRSWLTNPSYYYNKRNMEIEDKIRHKVSDMKVDSIMKPIVEGIALVKVGGYAYHTETDNADLLISQTFTQDELCELGTLSSMEKSLVYPAVQKDSPYKEFLTWSLMRLFERGIVSCMQQRTATRPVSCSGSQPRPLALGGAAPAFILLAFGFLISTLIMLAERHICKMKAQTALS